MEAFLSKELTVMKGALEAGLKGDYYLCGDLGDIPDLRHNTNNSYFSAREIIENINAFEKTTGVVLFPRKKDD